MAAGSVGILAVAVAALLVHRAPTQVAVSNTSGAAAMHIAPAGADGGRVPSTSGASTSGAAADLLPGMPPPLVPNDLYAADRPGLLAPMLADVTPRVYVPNSDGHTVTEIDPATFKVIRTFDVGRNPQHVVPSWDLKTLWVNNDKGNSLTPIDAVTGAVGAPIDVHDPYNLYFTPDGRYAIVVSERLHRLDFRDAQTMKLHRSLSVPCSGVNHMDFTADGRYLVASCEFDGGVVKVDVAHEKVVGTARLDPGGMPQDVKLSPDGKTFYIADMMANGVWMVDAQTLHKRGFIPTGAGAHGLYVSRDSRDLYVSNRSEGSRAPAQSKRGCGAQGNHDKRSSGKPSCKKDSWL